jgi:hypothetical protein
VSLEFELCFFALEHGVSIQNATNEKRTAQAASEIPRIVLRPQLPTAVGKKAATTVYEQSLFFKVVLQSSNVSLKLPILSTSKCQLLGCKGINSKITDRKFQCCCS